MQKIGIFGGTFDPVHNGHLHMAKYAKSSLGLDEVKLIPCYQPPHREAPVLSAQQRVALLTLAVGDQLGLSVDDRELRRDKPSYTVDTLACLRAELGDSTSLVLIVGEDAFAGMSSWYQWQRLRGLAHIAIMARPDSAPLQDSTLQQWLDNADSRAIVEQQAAGGVLVLDNPLLDISATHIRQQLMHNQTVNDLPASVAQYIKTHHLYSATDHSVSP